MLLFVVVVAVVFVVAVVLCCVLVCVCFMHACTCIYIYIHTLCVCVVEFFLLLLLLILVAVFVLVLAGVLLIFWLLFVVPVDIPCCYCFNVVFSLLNWLYVVPLTATIHLELVQFRGLVLPNPTKIHIKITSFCWIFDRLYFQDLL